MLWVFIMCFSLLSIKCSAAPPCPQLCYLNCAQGFDLITTRLVVVASKEEPPNIWLTAAKNAFVGWALNFGVRMSLKNAVKQGTVTVIIVRKCWIGEVLVKIWPIEGGVQSWKILNANVASLTLYIKCKESHLAVLKINYFCGRHILRKAVY